MDKLVPYLAGSASIVVHSPHVQVGLVTSKNKLQNLKQLVKILADLQTKMRGLPQYLCPSVTEAWLRRYQVLYSNTITPPPSTHSTQVLPGRTHPTMVMSGSGGFVLHAIKVYVRKAFPGLSLT